MNAFSTRREGNRALALACCRWACALLLLASASFAFAQFQAATAEELKMTSDPKAPGADAVFLYREETDLGRDSTEVYYVRIKVLMEKGKEMATVHWPYVHGYTKIQKIEGRTIHADGTIFPLSVKPEDLVEVKGKGVQLNSVVFTLPNVEVGSILEYRLKLQNQYGWETPTWEVQQDHFVHRAHYFYDPSYGGLMYAAHLGGDAKVVRAVNTATLDIQDVPPLPDEDWMPPMNTIRWRVLFYQLSVESGKEYWKLAAKGWAEYVNKFTATNGALKKTVAGIVNPEDSEGQKTRKIYAAVMKLENTDFSRKKSEAERKAHKLKEIKKAEDVWKDQAGGSDEIALLYVALARAAGLKAVPMQVVNRNRALFDQDFLSIDQLDDFIAVVNIDGKDVYLDPGEKMCPYGSLHWKHTLAQGFKLAGEDSVLALTPSPSYKGASTTQVANLELDSEGNVSGVARFAMTGPEALRWRQIALENDENEVKKQFNDSIRDSLPDGVTADFDHFLELENYESDLMAIVKVSGTLGAVTGKRFIVPGLFFESRAKHPFVGLDKRTTPIDVNYARMVSDEVTFTLPPGYVIESAPEAASAAWPGHASMKITSISEGKAVKVSRVLAYNFVLLPASDYPSLHEFYQKIATADQEQLVLAKAAGSAAKGSGQ
jgi:hypothetical protein